MVGGRVGLDGVEGPAEEQEWDDIALLWIYQGGGLGTWVGNVLRLKGTPKDCADRVIMCRARRASGKYATPSETLDQPELGNDRSPHADAIMTTR